MNCKSILVIDDDKDIRESCKEVLEWENYRVVTAENGQAALDLLKSLLPTELPGLIFLDLMMPIMGGMEFLDKIEKEHTELAKIPIILATANGRIETLPANPLLVEKIKKPLDIDEMFRMAKQYCGSPS